VKISLDVKKRRKLPWVVGTLMAVSFSVLIVLQSSNLWKDMSIDSSSDLILLYTLSSLNFVAFCVFAFVFARSIIRLIRERRTFQMGAQIKTKLLVYFFAVSLMPIIAMAVFSYLFLNRALDRWFAQIPQSIIQQARNAEPSPAINASLAELDRLSQQQVTIRRIGLLTLGILTFLLIFASSWIAFYVARGITEPIKALAEAADEIARGNLGHRVEVFAEDELALLVSTFNQMSATLESTSLALRERRKYIETVLETLPTGVISFDAADNVTTINRSAVNILRLGSEDHIGIALVDVVSDADHNSFSRLLSRARRVGHASDQISIKSDPNGNGARADITVALTATKLPTEGGVVLVIEDLSELIAAQRAFAWQEVARRMAHEIKNPLTPIQLSAERIAKRFSDTGHIDVGVRKRITDKGPIGDVVHESTATILREVTSLKSMVDEFSRFARLPATQLEAADLNDAIREAVATFDALPQGVRVDVNLRDDLPDALIDGEKIKQVFVNLIQNAVEALESDDTDARVAITSRFDSARDLIVAEVADNGRGIAPSDLQKLFQPYFSTKGRGTGLGLAIVHRIIMEHDGRIHAAQNQPRGAKFIIELPANG
jgi:PAS domain S-box-containing protein